ncbi:MAG: restriction endonuclease subunit S [Chloroflexota bacterium]
MTQQVQLKYVTRLAYGDSLPSDNEERRGSIKVYGSNGPYTEFSRANTQAPVIVIGRKGSYGKINWSDEPIFASDTTFFVDASTTNHHLRWIYYLLQTLNLDVGSHEAAVPGLNRDTAYSKTVLVPPPDKQAATVNYLDRETTKIDTLIVELDELLKLIAEKRQATISQAVTHGINPNVKLVDSGIEWIGEIPEHWDVTALKHVAEVRTGIAKGKRIDQNKAISVPYLRVANVQDGYIDLSDVAEIDVLEHEINMYTLRPGDVLMNEGGDIDKLGRGAVWDGSIDPCLHQNHVFSVRCHDIEPEWLSALTGAYYAKAYFESRAKRTTNLASISATNLSYLPVLTPSIQEQREIVIYINTQSAKLEELSKNIQETIEALHERRSALIAAAVTGKIRVTESPCK